MKTNQYLKDAHLPRCNWREFLTFKPSSDMLYIPQKDKDALDAYFIHFLPPSPNCIKCGSQQGVDGIMDVLLQKGKFKFGLKHGEGQCTVCGWPARAIHYNVGPIQKLELILQYHPDVVTWDD